MIRNPSGNTFSIKNILRALQYKNYRLFFGGQAVSLIGTWMQQIALSWLIYRLTGSPFLLGVVSFSSQIPTFLLSPIAGVYADHFDKRKILIITQSLSMIQAFLLVFLIAADLISVWWIITLNIMLGIINGFDMTSRQAFVVEMVENKDDIGNAIALNSMMFNLARLIGPSLAGIIIAAADETVCFLINGISYIGVIIALIKMNTPKPENTFRRNEILNNIKEGFKYTVEFTPVRIILGQVALISLAGMPYIVLMPVFAKEVLGGGADTLGFLIGAVGVGAFFGAIFLASRKTVLGLGRVIARTAFSFSVAVILFAHSDLLWVSLLLMAAAGFSAMVQLSSGNTIIQTITDDSMRGRVMSFYTMSFMGAAPLGSLIAGSSADAIGAPLTLTFGGLICMLGAIYFTNKLPVIKKLIKPIYVEKGIIKEVAKGMQSATHLRMPPQG